MEIYEQVMDSWKQKKKHIYVYCNVCRMPFCQLFPSKAFVKSDLSYIIDICI